MSAKLPHLIRIRKKRVPRLSYRSPRGNAAPDTQKLVTVKTSCSSLSCSAQTGGADTTVRFASLPSFATVELAGPVVLSAEHLSIKYPSCFRTKTSDAHPNIHPPKQRHSRAPRTRRLTLWPFCLNIFRIGMVNHAPNLAHNRKISTINHCQRLLNKLGRVNVYQLGLNHRLIRPSDSRKNNDTFSQLIIV